MVVLAFLQPQAGKGNMLRIYSAFARKYENEFSILLAHLSIDQGLLHPPYRFQRNADLV